MNETSKSFYVESNFLFDHAEIDTEIQKIISSLEKNTNEYIDNIDLMIDSPKMLSIGMSISKKIDSLKVRQDDIQFLVQEAKQLIIKYYKNMNITHIIINNFKINGIDYDYLPMDIKCNFISLDIFFICLPEEIIEYFKSFFHRFNISINQITCSSYAKATNYKNDFTLYQNISFIDVGFNKTSIITYSNNKITSLNVLPVGGNHITKDISKVLKINFDQAENLKINFNRNETFFSDKNFSLELLRKIIFARNEEIMEICTQSIKLILNTNNNYKIILMGEGSKILDNRYKDEVSFEPNVDFLEETIEDICQSGFKLATVLNKQEVIIVPKRQIKQGFFEKLFHLFN